MSTCNGFCLSCNKFVVLVMQRAKSLAIPAVTAAGAGLFAATSSKRDRLMRTVAGGVTGFVVGAAIDAFTPAVQHWVCGDCGCSKVSRAA